MSSVGPSLLFGIIGGLVGGCVITPIVMAVLIYRLYRLPPQRCPNCSTAMPRFSRPRNLEQVLWGSRTCQNCGHKIPDYFAPRP